MSDLPRPTVIRGSRGKSAKMLGIALVAVAVFSFDYVKAGTSPGFAVLGVGFFACLGLLALYGVVRPPELAIEEGGLRWRGLRSWRVAWSEIERFDLHQARRTSSVVIRYRAGRPSSKGRAFRPAAIPNMLWMEPSELTELLNNRLIEARAVEPALQGPLQQDATPSPLPTVARPWLSLALIAALAIVFVAEIQWPVTPATAPLTPSVITLAGFGALGRSLLVGPVDWFRLATAPFLHGSLGHLLANCLALFLAGRLLEGVIGRGWFAATYVVGALAGGCGSLLLNPANMVTVGASGAIMALFAAAYVCSFHFPRFEGRQGLQTRAISVLVPTLFAVGRPHGGVQIDFGAHLGGAIGGALAGAMLLKMWHKPMIRPPHQITGALIGGAGLATVILAIWPLSLQRDTLEKAALLAPAAAMPERDGDVIAQSASLLDRYPDDPRLHLAAALGDMVKGDASGAADQAQIGLIDIDKVRSLLKPSVEASLWGVLGESLMQRGRNADAASAFGKAAAIDPQLPAVDLDQAKVRLALGQLDDALAAANQATQRLPRDGKGWGLLGDIRFARVEIEQAKEAYEHENDVAPGPSPVRLRGLTRFYTGDAEGAVADLQHAAREGSQSLYWALWLDFVTERNGKPPTLDATLLSDNGGRWPAPVVNFFLGGITRDELLRQAEAAPDQTCEAGFYLSEYDLIHGQKEDAQQGFRKAAAECPAKFIETWMARAELAGGTPHAR